MFRPVCLWALCCLMQGCSSDSGSTVYNDDTCPLTRPAASSLCNGVGSCSYCYDRVIRERDLDGGVCADDAFYACACQTGAWLCQRPRFTPASESGPGPVDSGSGSKTYDDDTCPVTKPAASSPCDGVGSCSYCYDRVIRERDLDGGPCPSDQLSTCACQSAAWLCQP